MRIVLSIDTGNEWARPARWVLEQMLEVLGFDTSAGPPDTVPYLTVRYGGRSAALPAGVGEVSIPADQGVPPADYEPDDDFARRFAPEIRPDDSPRSESGAVRMAFDIVAPAWFFLSRSEEERGEKDALGRFVPGRSWQIRRRLQTIPVVDELGRRLLAAIDAAADRAGISGMRKLPWPGGNRFALTLTHDQDQSIRWKRRIVRSAIDLFRGGSRGGRFALKRLRRQIGEGAVAETIFTDRIFELEKESGIPGTFFFLPVRRDKFGRRYDVQSPPFRHLLRRLTDGGHAIGLHASLEAASSVDRLRSEREAIARAASHEVKGVRHHYLRLAFPHTWQLHERAGLRWDASLGYPDSPGLRAGTAFPFRPAGTEHFIALPLTGMDRALVAEGLVSEEKWNEWSRKVRSLGGLIDILWHPYFIDPDQGDNREELFRTLLSWISSLRGEAWVTTLDDVARWWEERRSFRLIGAERDRDRTVVRYRCGTATQPVGLTPVPPRSDMRIRNGAAEIVPGIAGEGSPPHLVTGEMRTGSEIVISLGSPRRLEEN